MPLPNVTAGVPTTLVLGQWNTLTDGFVPHPSSPTGTTINLNDGITWSLVDVGSSGLGEGLTLDNPAPEVYDAGNPRTIGRSITRRNYGSNPTIKAHLMLTTTSWSAFSTALHNLAQTLEGISESQPAALKIQTVQSSVALYADVVEAHFARNSPSYKEVLWNQLLEDGATVEFTARPHLRGARQTLQNLLMNPGFEAPMGGGVATVAPVAFADPLTNLHAYGDPGYEAAVLADAPLRYYPMDEAAGTSATNLGSEGTGSNGTYQSATLGVSGSIGSGSGDYAVAFSGGATSNLLGPASAALPLGSSAWTMEVWLKLAAYPGANMQGCAFGVSGSGNNAQLNVNSTGLPAVNISGFTQQQSAAALSLNAWHHLVGTYSGGTNGTLTLYVDGASVASGAISGTPAIAASAISTVGSNIGQSAFLACTADDFAIYGSALSAARVSAHYTANSAANNPVLSPANTYVDAVLSAANGGANLLRYYRLDESSGTSAYDIAGTGQTGTTHGSPTQGVAGLLAVDSDTCYTFASASSQYVSCPTTNMPTGNAAFSAHCWFKFAANPASSITLFAYGNNTNTAKTGFACWIDTSGKINADCYAGAGLITSAAAVSTGVAHHACVTYDGTTYRLYLDGAQVGSSTPGALALVGTICNIGTNYSTAYYNGQLDEVCFYNAALSATAVSSLYTAGHSGTSGVLANSMLVPAGALLQFGSSAWGAIQTWQVRFRYTTGLTFKAYLHYTNSSNYLLTQVANGTNGLGLYHDIAGTVNTLAQTNTTLTYEGYYWLSVTQFPAPSGVTPYVQATLCYDQDGVVGSQIGQIGAATTDAVTALAGQSALTASGASLVVGGTPGNASGAGQQVSLFGPGGWTGVPTATGQAPASLAWEQNAANTATLGATNSANNGLVQVPVTSFGAARIDAPSTGASGFTGLWQSAPPNPSLAQLQQLGTPVKNGGDVLVYTGMLRATGNGSGYHAYAQVNQYTSAGAFISGTQFTLALGSGSLATWAAWQFSLTTAANCAFVAISLVASDSTNSSASGSTWHDNVCCWDQTASGMTAMPYCETRSPSSPYVALLSGIQGDMCVPCATWVGMQSIDTPNGYNFPLQLYLASRAIATTGFASSAVQACAVQSPGSGSTPVLDGTSYGGYYIKSAWSNTGTFGNILAGGGGPIFALGQVSGAYHAYVRVRTLDPLPTKAKIQGFIIASFGFTSLSSSIGGATNINLPIQTPFTDNNWTVVDLGPLTLPVSALSPRAEVSNVYIQLNIQVENGTAALEEWDVNWFALLPVDDHSAVVNWFQAAGAINMPPPNSSGGFLLDGTGVGPLTALPTIVTGQPNVLPVYNQFINFTSGNVAGASFPIQSLMDPSLSLNPLVRLNGTVVNQLVAILTTTHDDPALVPPGYVHGGTLEVSYSPYYLFPL